MTMCTRIVFVGLLLLSLGCTHHQYNVNHQSHVDKCTSLGNFYSPLQNWEGTYRDEFGKTLKIVSYNQALAQLHFEFTQEAAPCHEGFKGDAAVITPVSATYKKDDLVISFTLKSGQVEVSEQGFKHDPTCVSFSGIYRK